MCYQYGAIYLAGTEDINSDCLILYLFVKSFWKIFSISLKFYSIVNQLYKFYFGKLL